MNIPNTVKRVPKILRNARRDLKYGRPLAGLVKTRYSDLGAHDVGNADYDDLPLLFSGLDVTPLDVIVDVGCGKGRSTNWFLERYPANKIYAIELDPAVFATTAKRLRRFNNVTMLRGDATTLLPADGTVFYLFNPFNSTVMARFIGALFEARSGATDGRPTTIVYYNDTCIDLYRNDPRFTVRPVDNPAPRHRSSLITMARLPSEPVASPLPARSRLIDMPSGGSSNG